jgi:hypothetical protein
MTNSELTARINNSRTAAWAPTGYDGHTHFGAVLGAAIPAFAILLVAAAFLVQAI